MDPISDMLIRIKNAQAVGHEKVSVPSSKVKLRIAEILKSAGYLDEVEKRKRPVRPANVRAEDQKSEKVNLKEHEYLDLTLKYYDNQGALNGIKIISKPSRRMYIQAKDIKPVRSGFGLAIISTPKGIMNSKEARKENVGGEIICEVW